MDHGKEVPPPETPVEFLQSYTKSLLLLRMYSTNEIIKGKMPLYETCSMPEIKNSVSAQHWPPSPANQEALLVDDSFVAHDEMVAAGIPFEDMMGA